MLTHKNILSNVMLSKESFPFEDRPDYKALSFLPLNHIFEKMVSYIYLFSGNSIYYAESMETIGANLLEVKPDLFSTVPRLLEKVYERIMAKGAELKGIKRKLFFWAVELGKKYDNRKTRESGIICNYLLANKLIFNKWREALGNNIKYIITGGAACQERLFRIFNGAGIPVYEGYGPRKIHRSYRSTAAARDWQTRNSGSCDKRPGIPAGSRWRNLRKGPSVMKGYFKRPDLTAETVIDGWLHTGDIGVLEDGIFTDHGPEKRIIQNQWRKICRSGCHRKQTQGIPFYRTGDCSGPERKFVGALIVPAFAAYGMVSNNMIDDDSVRP